jgi:hypothetical protein
MKFFYAAFICIVLLVASQFSFSQCLTAPASGTCSGGNGAIANNTNINPGNTYWYSASGGTIANVNLNGGTLRICGSLTITNINYNSGSIFIENGASLTINAGMNMNGNSSIINRGSLTINGNVALQNINNVLWNDFTTSILTINGTVAVNSATSIIINRGTFKATSLIIQGGGTALCMQDFSTTNLVNLANNTLNSIIYSGTGSPACLGITGSAQLNTNVTLSNKIFVCMAVGATKTGPGTFGGAVVTMNCTSCNVALPLNITGFTATNNGNNIKLTWTSGKITGSEFFNAEESDDGINFHSIEVVNSELNQSVYTAIDNNINNNIQYYRIKETDQSGKSIYSNIIIVKTGFDQNLSIYPNPVTNNNQVTILFTSTKTENASLSLMDISGKLIETKNIVLITGKNKTGWNLKNIPSGIYILKIQSTTQGNFYNRISVVND